jgi:alanyl-tRNA synthetase
MANEVIADNISVEIIFADEDLIKYLPLRKPPPRSGEIRVIKIGDFECSACGGTHCHSTSEVRLIKIIGTEKIRGRIAVKFLAGDLAFKDYTERFEVTDSLSREYTCHFTDLPEVVNKLADENKKMKREANSRQKDMLPAKVEQLAREAKKYNSTTFYAGIVDDIDLSHMPTLTSMLADTIGGLALMIRDDRMFLGASSKSGLHAGKIMKLATKELDLKGGGGNKLAQAGGADPASLKQYMDVFLKLLDG